MTAHGRAASAVLTSILLAACGGPPPAEPPSRLAPLVPDAADLVGWAVAEGPATYRPDTLFEHLDGGAERYLGHGFRELLVVRWQRGDDPLACVTLELFDMGTELGAFGIYSALRPPGAGPEPWGAEGYLAGTVAGAYRGRVFVHGQADDGRRELLELLTRAVSGAADRAGGSTAPPPVLDPLPEEGRIPRRERYVPADLLGHAFLPGGVMAEYELDGRRGTLFVSALGSEQAAREALAALRSHHRQTGTVAGATVGVGSDGFHFEDPTLGEGTAVRVGRHLAGIHGDLPADARERLLASLASALGSG